MNDLNLSSADVDFLLSPKAIRARARAIFDFTITGKGAFIFNEEQFKPTVDFVLSTIAKNYPKGDIPFHSRWGHFRAGGVDRASQLKEKIKHLDPLEQARTELDLVITSVLLDAGAGALWSYTEDSTKLKISRSEGLGVASFHMFMSGQFSSDGQSLRADAEGLRKTTSTDLRRAFQVSESNPLLGVDGRVQLLNNLADALQNKNIFKDQRPGNIIDALIKKYGDTIPAPGILRKVLDGLGPIWPGRLSAQGVNLGDVWRHSSLAPGLLDSLVPFHKLSQWMTYSLIEPMQAAGLKITGVEDLTGLAEYRNGGLILDTGLISLRNPEAVKREWKPDADLIIEWRALTVFLLDLIGLEVQKALGKTAAEFPLAKVLEGGTWWAGRFLAIAKRKNGEPPLQIQSDGTVF